MKSNKQFGREKGSGSKKGPKGSHPISKSFIPHLDDKEGIKRYLEERKRKFPTQERIKDTAKGANVDAEDRQDVSNDGKDQLGDEKSSENVQKEELILGEEKKICNFFLKGFCKNGSKCRNFHDFEKARSNIRARSMADRSLALSNILLEDVFDVEAAVRQVCAHLVQRGRS